MMSITINLLIAEDDDDQYEAYEDTATDLSCDTYQFKLTREKNSQAAQDALLSRNFDAAIIDLNLNASDVTEASGNIILENIIGTLRFPVFVVSGNLGMLNEEIREKKSSFLKFYDRSTSNNDIFDEIKKICCTGITSILGGRGLIESKLSEIFWNHLANDLDAWTENDRQSEKALLRYTISHLSEYLDQPSGDNDYYSDAEFYIKPPIRDYVATGDIAKNKENGSRFIVLSPACDIAVRGKCNNNIPIINAKRLTLAKLITVDRTNFIEKNIIQNDTNNKKLEEVLNKIITGQWDKFVFLPEYNELQASIADLQNLHTIDFNEYLNNYDRIATVASPFLKDIQSRFSSYYGRQGQPDLDKKALVKKNKSKCQ